MPAMLLQPIDSHIDQDGRCASGAPAAFPGAFRVRCPEGCGRKSRTLWRTRAGEVIAWKPPFGYRRNVSVATARGGVPGAPNPAAGCSAGWSSVDPVAWAFRATRCADAMERSIATITAATRTRSEPVASIVVARSATSAQTNSTPSSSNKSATRCCVPMFS